MLQSRDGAWWLTTADWLYRFPPFRRVIDLANRIPRQASQPDTPRWMMSFFIRSTRTEDIIQRAVSNCEACRGMRLREVTTAKRRKAVQPIRGRQPPRAAAGLKHRRVPSMGRSPQRSVHPDRGKSRAIECIQVNSGSIARRPHSSPFCDSKIEELKLPER